MLGNNQQQNQSGANPQQNPSMLDNVNTQDFTGVSGASQANQHHAQPAPQFNQPSPQPLNMAGPTAQNHPAPQPSVAPYNDPNSATGPSSHASHPSGPVSPPTTTTTQDDELDKDTLKEDINPDQDTYLGAITDDDDNSSSNQPVDVDKLSGMKKQALDHLEPLVGHLKQDPEDEFKTTMMMIQANDNHTLLDKALAAAKKIPDDKERAQAMLDIVNEINYFSQNSQDN